LGSKKGRRGTDPAAESDSKKLWNSTIRNAMKHQKIRKETFHVTPARNRKKKAAYFHKSKNHWGVRKEERSRAGYEGNGWAE